MSNGAAELHVVEWQAALRRSASWGGPIAAGLDVFFTTHLESAGMGMYGFDLVREDLAAPDIRRVFATLVAGVAQDIIDAAAGTPQRESLQFLARHDAHWQAVWVSWERVLFGWVRSELSSAVDLDIPESLDAASRALV